MVLFQCELPTETVFLTHEDSTNWDGSDQTNVVTNSSKCRPAVVWT